MPVALFRAKLAQAIQWTGETNCSEVFAFLGMDHPDEELDHGLIYLPNGDEVRPGDWVVWDGNSFRSLSADQFAAAYEPA